MERETVSRAGNLELDQSGVVLPRKGGPFYFRGVLRVDGAPRIGDRNVVVDTSEGRKNLAGNTQVAVGAWVTSECSGR